MTSAWLAFWNGSHSIYVSARHKDVHYRLIAKAIAALVPRPHARVLDYVRERTQAPFEAQYPDVGARYVERRTIELGEMEPLVALPGKVIGNAVGVIGFRPEKSIPKSSRFVKMTTRRPNSTRRHKHARANHNSFRDRIPQRDINVIVGPIRARTDVTDGGKPRFNRHARCWNHAVGLGGSRHLQFSQTCRLVVAQIEREMGVRVHKPRRQRRVPEIDHLRARRNGNIRTRISDFVALDQDDSILSQCSGFPIEQPRCFQRDNLIGRDRRFNQKR